MLEVLVLTLECIQEEASPFGQIGQEINWDKTKIQTIVDSSVPQHFEVADNSVDIFE